MLKTGWEEMKDNIVHEPSPTQEHVGIAQPLTQHGSALFLRCILPDDSFDGINRRVWAETPWVVDAFTGPCTDDRDCKMRIWCDEHFGPQAWPIHGKPGRWYRGSATIHGWTWFGFSTESEMREFEAAWPSPSDGSASDRVTADAEPSTGRLGHINPPSNLSGEAG